MPLLKLTPNGLYCEKANVYIDPWRKVDKALITHAHSDHARKGMKSYLSHHLSVDILKHRLHKHINIQGIEYEKPIVINGVEITFFPAGHIIGSSQIRLRDKHECWVISGDYNISQDELIESFIPVECDTFVTESTFGLPVFQWEDPSIVFEEINKWWKENQSNNHPSVISAYSLGKAQRVIQNIDHSIGPVLTHPAVENINKIFRNSGVNLKSSMVVSDQQQDMLNKSIIICPPGANDSAWLNNIKNHKFAFASGWMALRGTRRRRNAEKGFVLSDHADWNALNKAVALTQAERVFVTHGYTKTFSKWISEKGIESSVLKTLFEGESLDVSNIMV
ncbi:MAG: ligase-associated DNA damage response exonuclease [Bacteroidia bacterium]|nr:ligase-associated DNA damage response exonuclease [Bacteroidia bacterium]